MAVATAVSVTPAHATKASGSKSPKHASKPSPPVAGCKPASINARPVSTKKGVIHKLVYHSSTLINRKVDSYGTNFSQSAVSMFM